jgi:hypothetical protein
LGPGKEGFEWHGVHVAGQVLSGDYYEKRKLSVATDLGQPSFRARSAKYGPRNGGPGSLECLRQLNYAVSFTQPVHLPARFPARTHTGAARL